MRLEKSSTTNKAMWDDDDDEPFPFVIHTIEEGHNSGKSIILAASSQEELRQWIAGIEAAIELSKEEELRKNETSVLHTAMRKAAVLYNTHAVQYSVALVIFASYVTALVRGEAGEAGEAGGAGETGGAGGAGEGHVSQSSVTEGDTVNCDAAVHV